MVADDAYYDEDSNPPPGPPKEDLILALDRYKDSAAVRLVLEHGIDYEPALKPEHIADGEKGSCFHNAYQLALQNDEYSLVAGYANAPPAHWFPSRHGWCVDGQGRVIDPTWGYAKGLPLALRGIVLPLDLAAEFSLPESCGPLEGYEDAGRFAELVSALGFGEPEGYELPPFEDD